jgi:hypothetical protein
MELAPRVEHQGPGIITEPFQTGTVVYASQAAAVRTQTLEPHLQDLQI